MKKLKAILCVGMLVLSSAVMTGCGTDAEETSETSTETVYKLDCCGELTMNKSNKTFSVSGYKDFSGSGSYIGNFPHGGATLTTSDNKHKGVMQVDGESAHIEVVK